MSAPEVIVRVLDHLGSDKLAARLFDHQFAQRWLPPQARNSRDLLAWYLEQPATPGWDPNWLFSVDYYLQRNPDVAAAGIHPLVHYVQHGAREGRSPHPLFDTGFYASRYPEISEGYPNPLVHYLEVGSFEDRDPHPLFSVEHYRAQLPAAERPTHALWHFATEGWRRGYDPHPLFDTSFYVASVGTEALAATDPLSHFNTDSTLDPHPLFSVADYRAAYAGLLHGWHNPLVHFVTVGAANGLLPKSTFSVDRHHRAVTALDSIRHDGKPVILFITHIGGGGTERHINDLRRLLGSRCHVLLLMPANYHVLGPGVRPLVTLSAPAETDAPALLIDPVHAFDDLVMLIRALGVERIHVHHALGHEAYIQRLLASDVAPHDVTIHDFYFLSPDPHLTGGDGRYAGEPDDDVVITGVSGANVKSYRDWRTRMSPIITRAERVIAPSSDAAARVRRYFPRRDIIVAPHPGARCRRPSQVRVRPVKGDMRVAIIGQFSPHKGSRLVEQCAELAAARNLPLEFHAVGIPTVPARTELPRLILHGAYPEDHLPAILADLRPHIAWFPAQCPETFSYTLDAALAAELPIMAGNIGVFPERLAGRPWTWLRPWQDDAAAWCRNLLEAREAIVNRREPRPITAPPGLPRRDDFYEDAYLQPRAARAPVQ